jgi:hypothetical protein
MIVTIPKPLLRRLFLVAAACSLFTDPVSIAQARPKPHVWLCQANHAMECGAKGCKLERNNAASITFNRSTQKIDVCLYSQCLTGKARYVRGAGTDLEQVWVRATSKPGYPNPITTVLMVRFDWRRMRFLLFRPGRIFHGGPCRPQRK